MDQDRAISLLLRQIKDIQAQADKIMSGENSNEAIENFAKYSTELRSCIKTNVGSKEIKSYLAELPEINYSRMEIKLWQYLILPSWWISMYKDYQAKNEAIEEIKMTRGKYASLECCNKFLVLQVSGIYVGNKYKKMHYEKDHFTFRFWMDCYFRIFAGIGK